MASYTQELYEITLDKIKKSKTWDEIEAFLQNAINEAYYKGKDDEKNKVHAAVKNLIQDVDYESYDYYDDSDCWKEEL